MRSFACLSQPLTIKATCRTPSYLATMDAAAVAALAAAVDHVHAAALNELLLQCQQLKKERDQLEKERDQLELERDQLQIESGYLRCTMQRSGRLRVTMAWALRDLRMGEIETAEERLAQVVEGSDDD